MAALGGVDLFFLSPKFGTNSARGHFERVEVDVHCQATQPKNKALATPGDGADPAALWLRSEHAFITASAGVPAVAMPPSFPAEDIVGRWGLAAYHRDQDRARTITEARDQCTQAYLIERSPGGNVLMLGHDNPQKQEMILKGSIDGKTYIGPGPYPGIEDREVVSFDGQVLILKWVNPEVAGRYGIMVLRAGLFRCSAGRS